MTSACVSALRKRRLRPSKPNLSIWTGSAATSSRAGRSGHLRSLIDAIDDYVEQITVDRTKLHTQTTGADDDDDEGRQLRRQEILDYSKVHRPIHLRTGCGVREQTRPLRKFNLSHWGLK